MSIFPTMRTLSYLGALWRGQGVPTDVTTGAWQDKSPHGAAQAGGCSGSCFRRVPHRAVPLRTVRLTLNSLTFGAVLHRAGLNHE